MENLKKMAGIKAAEFVKDGMVVGLGTGSTAYYFVEEIGRRIKEEGLQITAVTTSSVTSKQAEGLNIPLKSIDQVDFVDVTVDGADEVDSQFNGIKGGGGALLMEKVVATPSKEYIWVVDESKLVEKLGAFKLPVEVVQYGAEQVFRRFELQLKRRIVSKKKSLKLPRSRFRNYWLTIKSVPRNKRSRKLPIKLNKVNSLTVWIVSKTSRLELKVWKIS